MDLTSQYEGLYQQCLEDWSDEIKEAGEHKARWYGRMKDKGLRVKLARDDQGVIGGMIQHLPIEHAQLEGRDLDFVHCIWVHGHRQGRGNFQGKGMGKALLTAAEEDTRDRGKKGLVVWGLSLPVFMKASWFKRRGYRPVDRMGIQVLLWKPFAADAEAPRWVRRRKRPRAAAGGVTVSAFISGWCPVQNMVYERARRAAAELGDRVHFESHDTLEPGVFAEWGIADGLFVDGKEVRTGPPPSYESLRRLIEGRLKRLRP